MSVPAPIYCPACGKPGQSTDLFCAGCGRRLGAGPAGQYGRQVSPTTKGPIIGPLGIVLIVLLSLVALQIVSQQQSGQQQTLIDNADRDCGSGHTQLCTDDIEQLRARGDDNDASIDDGKAEAVDHGYIR
jgi:hypothetical protein